MPGKHDGTTAEPGGTLRLAALGAAALFGLAAAAGGWLWWSSGVAANPLAGPEALAAQSVRALRGGDVAAAQEALTRELAWNPRSASAWCRQAYARYRLSGRFDASVQQALLTSYEAAPLDAEAFAWRLQFIFENWGAASPPLRDRAVAEARAFHGQWPTHGAVRNVLAQVRDPTGQLALRLAVRSAPPKGR
ncbi:MAG: hypothetical protein ACK41C_09185 [Phenylobacterium sp.]|uniref:hypothetical protein n=1 Tax=Phenylobacterium sp. TaxID=1871053 RepID=UPI00391CFBC0